MKYKCDFCGKVKEVIRTNYGTSHYIRLMCNDCKERIEKIENREIKELKEDNN